MSDQPNPNFELALRSKLRFNYKGLINTEELWDLSVEALDDIYKNLKQQVNTRQEESLLTKPSQKDEELDLKISIVKFIVTSKLNQVKHQQEAFAKAAQKQKLLSILAKKEEAALEGLTPEELKQMLEKL